jgi:regulatory protein
VHIILERIETAGPGSKARRLVFNDGLDPRCTSAAAVKELKLEAGAEVSRESVESALAKIEYDLARDRALKLLGYREHSAAELRRKLRDNGYPANISSAVTDRFVEVELVDDVRFANIWTRSRVAAGYGGRRIKQELAQRGIDPDLIESTWSAYSDSDEELANACAALGSRRATDRSGRDKLVRRLVSRGFAFSVAIAAVDTVSATDGD